MSIRSLVLAALSFAAIVALPRLGFAQYDLTAGRGFPASGDGRALALADVDEDGALDVVVPGGPGLFVHSLRGPFAPASAPITLGVAGIVDTLAAADFDSDGHADIAVAASAAGQSRVDVLFGDGQGGFVSAPAATPNDVVSSIAVLDANGDGLLDFAIPREQLQSVSLILQNGLAPRTFLTPATVSVGGTGMHVAAGDFNGDGFADVVAAVESARSIVLLDGDGAGGFAGLRSFVRNRATIAIDTGDFDRDGLSDVLATDAHLFVLRGDRLWGLVPAWVGPQGPTDQELVASDLDGDGVLDVASGGRSLATWRGDGAGGFTFVEGYESMRYDGELAAGDVDGDGRADVMGTRPLSSSVDILLGTGTGSLLVPEHLANASRGQGVAVDANADGIVDLVFPGVNGLEFFFGDGQGGFFPRGYAALVEDPFHITAADLRGSSEIDLVITNSLAGNASVLEGSGGGFIDRGVLTTGAKAIMSASGDFDGDGSADVATALGGSDFVVVHFGNGAGGFVRSQVGVGSAQGGLSAADFDRDGFADLAVSVLSPPGLTVLYGNAGRTFTSIGSPAVGPAPAGVAIADLDRDGNVDVVVGDSGAAALHVLFGDGARGLGRTATFVTPRPPIAVSVGDATGDGLRDVLAAHGTSRLFSVMAGDGHGALDGAKIFHSWSDAMSIFTVDLAGDGSPEVVVPGALYRIRETALSSCLRGTVDAGRGPARDVLFVNGVSGGFSRVVRLRPSDPLVVLVAKPPAEIGVAEYAAYAWIGVPSRSTVRSLPSGLGSIAMPMPLAPGTPAPREIWNNIGRYGNLGVPTRPSRPAPSFLVQLPAGVGRAATFTLQGIIVDAGAPNGIAAVTNGVVVEVR